MMKDRLQLNALWTSYAINIQLLQWEVASVKLVCPIFCTAEC